MEESRRLLKHKVRQYEQLMGGARLVEIRRFANQVILKGGFLGWLFGKKDADTDDNEDSGPTQEEMNFEEWCDCNDGCGKPGNNLNGDCFDYCDNNFNGPYDDDDCPKIKAAEA